MKNKKQKIYFLLELQGIPNTDTVRSWSIHFNDQKVFHSIIKDKAANFPKKLYKVYMKNSLARKFKGWWIGNKFDIYLNKISANFGPLTSDEIKRICYNTSPYFVIYTSKVPYYQETVWKNISIHEPVVPAIWIEAIDKEGNSILTYCGSDPSKESLDAFLDAYKITSNKSSYHLSFIIQSEDIHEGFDVMEADILKKCCKDGKILVKFFISK